MRHMSMMLLGVPSNKRSVVHTAHREIVDAAVQPLHLALPALTLYELDEIPLLRVLRLIQRANVFVVLLLRLQRCA